MHPGSVRIGDVPPPDFRARPDQRQDSVREGSHKVILMKRSCDRKAVTLYPGLESLLIRRN
jgi:hypothetical protein